MDDETACDENGNLLVLSLGHNGLIGEIPAELGYLTHLQVLHLGGNKLEGTLPRSLTRLTALREFTVDDNKLSGPLPSDDRGKAFWKDLEVWNMQNNQFTGTLSNSMLDGMARLHIWNMHNNKLHGELPGDAVQSMSSSLAFVDLSENRFSGPLPDAWGNLTELVSLRIGKNALTRITPNVVNMGNLRTLHMPLNRLQGPLLLEQANGIGLAVQHLVDLDLTHNLLTGKLPSFARTTNLLELDLSHNLFSGEIPESIGGLANLLRLDLRSNRLSGRIPQQLGNLRSLLEVRLDQNDLTGLVPQEVCNAFSLLATTLYADCVAGDGNLSPKVICPPGICCTFCCAEGRGCQCAFANTDFEYLC